MYVHADQFIKPSIKIHYKGKSFIRFGAGQNTVGPLCSNLNLFMKGILVGTSVP